MKINLIMITFIIIIFITIGVAFFFSIEPVHPEYETISIPDYYLYTIDGKIFPLDGTYRCKYKFKGKSPYILSMNKESILCRQTDNIYYLITKGGSQEIIIRNILLKAKVIKNELFILYSSNSEKSNIIEIHNNGSIKRFKVKSYEVDYNGEYIAYIDDNHNVIIVDPRTENEIHLSQKAFLVAWNKDDLIIFTNSEIKRYNIATGSTDLITKHKFARYINSVDKKGRYMIITGRQYRGLGEFDAKYILDLDKKTIRLLPEIFQWDEKVSGIIAKDQLDEIKDYFIELN